MAAQKDSDRVRQWRTDQAKQGGRAVNIWLKPEAAEALDFLARGRKRVTSDIVNQALTELASRVKAGDAVVPDSPYQESVIVTLQDTVKVLLERVQALENQVGILMGQKADIQDTHQETYVVTPDNQYQDTSFVTLQEKESEQEPYQDTNQDTSVDTDTLASIDTSVDTLQEIDERKGPYQDTSVDTNQDTPDLSKQDTNVDTFLDTNFTGLAEKILNAKGRSERAELVDSVLIELSSKPEMTSSKIADALNKAGMPLVRGEGTWNAKNVQTRVLRAIKK